MRSPPAFVHPDPLHPYSRLLHPVTPIRWMLYLDTPAVGWCGVLPLLLLWRLLRGLGVLLLGAWDCIWAPLVSFSGDAGAVSSSSADATAIAIAPTWTVVRPRLVRLHPVSPQDRIWLTPRTPSHSVGGASRSAGSAAAPSYAPGASPSSVIHALLVMSRQTPLSWWQARFAQAIARGQPLERMGWRAVTRRTRRRALPNWLGGCSDQLCWMEQLQVDDGAASANAESAAAEPAFMPLDSAPSLSSSRPSFDVARHVRVVPWAEWAHHSLESSVAGPKGAGRHRQRHRDQPPEIGWPDPAASFRCDSDSDSADQQQQQQQSLVDLENGTAAAADPSFQLPPLPAVDHAEVLRTAQLQAYLSHLSATPLAPNQPLWELLVLESESTATASASPIAAAASSSSSSSASSTNGPSLNEQPEQGLAVFRCSHAIADGVLLSGTILRQLLGGGLEDIGVATQPSMQPTNLRENAAGDAPPQHTATTTRNAEKSKLLEDTPAPAAVSPAADTVSAAVDAAARPAHTPRRRSSCGQFCARLYGWYLFLLTGPYLLLHKSFQADDDNTLTRGAHSSSSCSSGSSTSALAVCWSAPGLPLASVKSLSRALGVSLNDLLVNIWMDVVDEYMQAVELSEQQQCEREQRHRTAAAATVEAAEAEAIGDSSDATSSSSVAAAAATRRRITRAPRRVFTIVPFNVRPARELEWNQQPTAAATTASASPMELGNKFAVLMVDLPMGSACPTPPLLRLSLLPSPPPRWCLLVLLSCVGCLSFPGTCVG